MHRTRALAAVVAIGVLFGVARPAAAQTSSLTLRGNYWRDRNTRVLAPEAVLRKEMPSGTAVEAHYLLDAITSASVASGVTSDQLFTELRHEVGVRISQRVRHVTVDAHYRYSSESDYWAHTGGAGVRVDLLQRNLTIGANYTYGKAWIARRIGPTGYVWARNTRDESDLDAHTAVVTFSQVLARAVIAEAGYELRVEDGFQANPYRTTRVGVACATPPDPARGLPGAGCTGGSPQREEVPSLRVGHTATVGVRYTPLYHRGALEYLTLHARYRLYGDDWGIVAHTPELRAYIGLGPTELRLTGRVHTQGPARFAAEADGLPQYVMGVLHPHCPAQTGCYAGDPKLYEFQTVFAEGRFLLDLRVLDVRGMPLRGWISRGTIAVSAGYYWNNRTVERVFGNAAVGGVELTFPL